MTPSFAPMERPKLIIPKSAFSVGNLTLFLLPILSGFSFNFVGSFLVSDIFVVLILLYLLNKRQVSLNIPFLKGMLLLLLVWFVAAIFSDLTNGSSMKNLLRGWAKIGFFALYIIVFMTLVKNDRNKAALALLGYTVAIFVDVGFLKDASRSFLLEWKFSLGLSVTIALALALTAMTGRRRLTSLFILLFSPVHLFLGARSLFLMSFLASISAFFATRIKSRKARQSANVVIIAVFASGLILGQGVYDSVVRTGIFGQQALDKHLTQTQGTSNILFGGRTESIISFKAISDRPLLGHGSWAEGQEYRLLYFKLREASGEHINWEDDFVYQSNLIPSHSMIFGAWVDHGVMGALFWANALFLAFRALLNGIHGPRPGSSMEFLAVFYLIWHILFSPFGATQRCFIAIFITIAAALLTSNTQPRSPT